MIVRKMVGSACIYTLTSQIDQQVTVYTKITDFSTRQIICKIRQLCDNVIVLRPDAGYNVYSPHIQGNQTI